MAALRDIEGATGPARQKAAAKAQALSQGLLQHIEGDPRVAACDQNPMGIKVDILGTLAPALEKMDKALGALAKN